MLAARKGSKTPRRTSRKVKKRRRPAPGMNDKQKLLLGLGAVLGGIFLLVQIRAIINSFGTALLKKPPNHGVCFSCESKTPSARTNESLSELRDSIQMRFRRIRTPIYWERVSSNRFRVYAPIEDRLAIDAAKDLICRRGLLEFRIVRHKSPALESLFVDAKYFEVKKLRRPEPFYTNAHEYYLFNKTADLDRVRIRQAMAQRDPAQDVYRICFWLVPECTEAFAKITRENVGRQLAMIVDDELLTAPFIKAEIPDGFGAIDFGFDGVKATCMAALLETPLPCRVNLLDTRAY